MGPLRVWTLMPPLGLTDSSYRVCGGDTVKHVENDNKKKLSSGI